MALGRAAYVFSPLRRCCLDDSCHNSVARVTIPSLQLWCSFRSESSIDKGWKLVGVQDQAVCSRRNRDRTLSVVSYGEARDAKHSSLLLKSTRVGNNCMSGAN